MTVAIDHTPPTREQLLAWGITNIVFDSQEVKKGSLFCALIGTHTDGHHYLDDAIGRGAVALLISDSYQPQNDRLYLSSTDTRLAMAQLASILYNCPSNRIKTIGVTGTDGKSTSVYLIEQLLELSGKRAGLISTVSIKVDDKLVDNTMRQSTPEAPQIEEALQTMIEQGLQYAVVEATSHGLSERTGRLSYINFGAALFTNVTIEHLEFHGTLEQYRNDKANLFRNVARHKGFAVINKADAYHPLFIQAATGSTIRTYGSPDADLFATNIEQQSSGNRFTINYQGQQQTVFCPLPGLFNVENALGALLLVSCILGKSPLELAALLEKVKGPKGRMVVVQSSPFTVIVDYAHTPGSFERLLPSVKASAKGQVIVVFGSGGERNKEKRPIQGQLADRWADVVILTDEDPRLEESIEILNDIASGISNKQREKNLFLISDRKQAMAKAFALARPGDVVLLLGKGHESCIIGHNGKMPWDEEQVALELLTHYRS